jgi:UDP-glucose 4-epimerase
MNGEAYNVASGIRVSLNTLIEILSSIINVTPKVEYKPERPGDIKYFDVDNSKIEARLPYVPGMDYYHWTNFSKALRETIEYYETERR